LLDQKEKRPVGSLPPSKPPTGPAPPRRSVCAPAWAVVILSQTTFAKETTNVIQPPTPVLEPPASRRPSGPSDRQAVRRSARRPGRAKHLHGRDSGRQRTRFAAASDPRRQHSARRRRDRVRSRGP